jgi:anti-sigma regulatory factor (Ser/Thr protein kinase)
LTSVNLSRDELEVRARFAMLPVTAEFARDFCERHRVGRAAALHLKLVIEELFTNTIEHGYRGECDAPIRIALMLDGGNLVLQYEDRAPEYDPRERLSTPPSSLEEPVESRAVGGIGVYLVGQLARDVDYVREDGQNRLRLTLRQ